MKRITKSSIAKMYGVSRPTLSRWISENDFLYQRLKSMGYDDGRLVLSPRILQCILDELGDPQQETD